ncbi:unnamed protein product [Acanthoscelides obtectus]|uniref:Uncharacterized protein n=1 Tax=Acanthoscelides obtectus TaxID=200917 RepID=A0A9P0NZ78_ACAOB|nr:unnamed protein product [Acanthoscelides obtectus]CAK1663484.1 hypothetical protein AOBTE_LOCUS23700 [Acanthoscelides obtectus]
MVLTVGSQPAATTLLLYPGLGPALAEEVENTDG